MGIQNAVRFPRAIERCRPQRPPRPGAGWPIGREGRGARLGQSPALERFALHHAVSMGVRVGAAARPSLMRDGKLLNANYNRSLEQNPITFISNRVTRAA